jgi:hypothetical protein
MVLFGGITQAQPVLGETWTFDGKAWTHHHPSISPLGRQGAAMAYDSARQRTVLFGGVTIPQTGKGMVEMRDTWTWDGRSWREEHPVLVPATSNMQMAYDPASRLVIGFYVEPILQGKSHTMAWNGMDWQELHPATQPALSNVGTPVSDGNRLLYVAQAVAADGGRYTSQTWSWDGRDWQRLQPRINLPSVGANAVLDRSTGLVLVLNGDTWTFDGSTWTRQHPTIQPSAGAYLAYVPALKKVVAWGDRFSSQNGDLLAWDGSDWTMLKAGPPMPPPASKGWTVEGTLSPGDAAVSIRNTVTTAKPVLLPSQLPAAIVEAAVFAGPDGFNVVYRSDQRELSITFGIVVANPPPGSERTSTRTVNFRGVTAQYQVYEPSAPLSQRWLMWNEPGTMAQPMTKATGVPYFLSADGLTDAEFWQVANSLK